MTLTLIAIAGGLGLLVLGGHLLVQGAVTLALRLNVSPLVVGLTVVGFGTSTPELVTSLQAAWRDLPGIAVGNVVGSNICNILLILGLAALVYPVTVDRRAFRRDGAMLLAATLLGVAVVLGGSLQRGFGLVLLAGLAAYLLIAYRAEAVSQEPEAVAPSRTPAWRAVAEAAGGIALTIVGAHLLVGAAVMLAADMGVPEAVVGLTVVALGTSLPELATSVVAALRRQPEVAFGNVVGSNIFNVLGILGVTALVTPIAVPPQIAATDVWVMLGATLALILVALRGTLGRATGAVLLTGYAAYVAWLGVGLF
ncbi:calcium/sodium antiporter [Sulfitobacter sp. D35]|uniref:calcium/sodium antiporter n=1 Tax=Sulfitobacter sp. D35 TaxID=3083252 RepID=UPI00296FA29C|nr:calcium/sodium antiporter [Sulfitobacter sp. D35]MDW4497409.1 calcium/sodium antiporter [Sulfitobacter sp. D35]